MFIIGLGNIYQGLTNARYVKLRIPSISQILAKDLIEKRTPEISKIGNGYVEAAIGNMMRR